MTVVSCKGVILRWPRLPSPRDGTWAKTCYTRPVHYLDFLDICAILLGIYFTITKLDAQGRRAEAFPHVAPADFERWRTTTTAIFRLGSAVCFLRVLFHQGWALYLSRHPVNTPGAPKSLVIPALIMDAAFLVVVGLTFVRASRAGALRRELGIVLRPMTPQQRAAAAAVDEDNSGRGER